MTTNTVNAIGRRSLKGVPTWENTLRVPMQEHLNQSNIAYRKYPTRANKHLRARLARRKAPVANPIMDKARTALANALRLRCPELSAANNTEEKFLNALYSRLWREFPNSNHKIFAKHVIDFINKAK